MYIIFAFNKNICNKIEQKYKLLIASFILYGTLHFFPTFSKIDKCFIKNRIFYRVLISSIDLFFFVFSQNYYFISLFFFEGRRIVLDTFHYYFHYFFRFVCSSKTSRGYTLGKSKTKINIVIVFHMLLPPRIAQCPNALKIFIFFSFHYHLIHYNN